MKNFLLTILLQCGMAGLLLSQGITLPYHTGFDSTSERAGWQQYRTGIAAISDWSYSGVVYASSPTGLSHDYNVGGVSTDTVIDWYVSPALNITPHGKIALKVITNGFSTPFPDNFEIWFGTNDQDPATGNFVRIGNLSFMLPQDHWLDTILDIPSVSDSGFIALKYKTIGSSWSTYGIDNIFVTGDSVSGLNDRISTGQLSVKIHPNPFKTAATITVNNSDPASPVDLVIVDINGREIKRMDRVRNGEIVITREGMINGMYFVNMIRDGKTIESEKMIIE